MKLKPFAAIATAVVAGGVAIPAAFADDQPAAAPAAWADSIKFSGQVEVGVAGNPDDPNSGINWGHAFTDRANSFVMNQAVLTVERDLDPKNPNFDIGFKLQGQYGTDSRYTHFLGVADYATHSPYQWDIIEADVTAHLPVLTSGGIDVKAGMYPTPLGNEVINPSGNAFYTHSYIFNYGLPLKHTGVLTTTHVNDWLDIWAGVDSGVNTSLGEGDNNNSAAGIFGFGLNGLLGGNLTVLALSHIGPENGNGPLNGGAPVDNWVRQFYDVVAIYKINDSWTSTTEFNYARDDAFDATAEGVATYLSYAANDILTLNGRAEVYRDDKGFFVGAFPGSQDFVNAEYARPNTSVFASKPPDGATYGEFTFGVTIKPPVPTILTGLMIRPEIRYDTNLDSGATTYNDFTEDHQVTASVDLVVPF